jgi:hypothetical protein
LLFHVHHSESPHMPELSYMLQPIPHVLRKKNSRKDWKK